MTSKLAKDSFEESAYFQTYYQGVLRHDEIMVLIELLDKIDLNVYGANNAILKNTLRNKLRQFVKVEVLKE